MKVTLETVLERIIAVNHAWKLSREEFGQDFVATKSLRDTKSSLQATLVRDFPEDVYLKVATDSESHGETMFSVRLRKPITINDVVRVDAEHLPARIAKQIFSEHEIQKYLGN
ncbi:hypothetical protein NM09_06810 [Vibrio caribbeanicus]|uniref:Uncharacterized protein n=1 Tax=Vibrio caribbeanicus TaxID=701175 RepID=A0ACC4NYC0_9VIBR|nr:hypothetical protein [Vibrio caribbeanicus]KHD25432.1 hypothetical protein NM09_06810 [Vibrio caribbeanicus]